MEQFNSVLIKKNRIPHNIPLKRKLIIIFILFFIILASNYIYLSIGYGYSSNFVQDFLSENQELSNLRKNLQTLIFYTETFISSEKESDLEKLSSNIIYINFLIKSKLPKYESLSNIIRNILDDTEKTINLSDSNYLNNHKILTTEVLLCQKYIDKIINNNITNLSDKSEVINNYLASIEQKTLLMSIITAISTIIFIIYFSINITKPLNNIIKNAKEISKGNFNIESIEVNTRDELKSIANVFNQMVYDIKTLIKKLEEKIGIERELQEEKVENLQMSNLLREAELKRLQSQINPHFLYNTLNSITQVAILEEANQTGSLIKKIAELLRYNLKETKKAVSLEKEIESIQLYSDIMKIRFDNRIKIKLSFPEQIENTYIPGMILQPLIENSILHGVKVEQDGYGIITIIISKKANFLEIKVRDNGCGIAKEKIKQIFSLSEDRISGLRNIKERLELYYGNSNLLSLTSKKGEFTEITIKIPETN